MKSFLGWELGINHGWRRNIKLLVVPVEGHAEVTRSFNTALALIFQC